MKHITIFDNHVFVRQGIETIIKQVLPSATITASDSIPDTHCITTLETDLIVCDYRVGDNFVFTLLKAISKHPHPPPVLVISIMEEAQIIPPCIAAGASGFVSISAPADEFITAVNMLLAGRTYFSARATKAVFANPTSTQQCITKQLSRRELQVFSVLGEGIPVSAIAKRLGISVKTVESHRENIKNKLNLHTASEVVIAASQWLSSSS